MAGEGFSEEEVMEMLFGEELRDFYKDAMERSNAENLILMDVLYRTGNDTGNGDEEKIHGNEELPVDSFAKDLAMEPLGGEGMTAMEPLGGEGMTAIEPLGSEGMTAMEPLGGEGMTAENEYQAVYCPGISACGRFQSDASQASEKCPNIASVDGDDYAAPPDVFTGASMPHFLVSSQWAPNAMFELVGQNTVSSNFQYSPQGIVTGNAGSNYVSFDSNHGSKPAEACNIMANGENATSSFPHEIIPAELQGTCVDANIESNPRIFSFADQVTEDTGALDMDAVDPAMEGAKKASQARELPCQLESYAHGLLTEAGWKIGHRVRNDRTKLAFSFKPPVNGPVQSSLVKAWKACGAQLFKNEPNSQKDEVGRQWENINQFLSEFLELQSVLDQENGHSQNCMSLWRRWQLLDPFIAVVWIDKKIGVLREGKALKAVQSSTYVVDNNTGKAPVEPNSSSSGFRKKKNSQSFLADVHRNSSIWNKKTNRKPRSFTFVHQTTSGPEAQRSVSHYPDTAYSFDERNIPSSEADSNSACTIDFHHQQQKLNAIAKRGLVAEILKHGLENASGKNRVIALPRKAFKKSKKISEIEAAQVNQKNMKSNIPRKNCSEEPDVVRYCIDVPSHDQGLGGVQEDTGKSEAPERTNDHTFDDSYNRILVRPKTTFVWQDTKDKNHSLSTPSDGDGSTSSLSNAHMDKKNIPLPSKVGKIIKRFRRSPSQQNCSSKSKKFKKQLDNTRENDVTDSIDAEPHCERKSYEYGNLSSDAGASLDNSKNKKLKTVKVTGADKENSQKRKRGCHFDDDDLLICAVLKKKGFVPSGTSSTPKLGASQRKEALMKLKGRKGSRKLLLRAPGNQKKFAVGARTVLCWLIEKGVLIPKDAIEYRNPTNEEVMKNGWVTREGILCKCCSSLLSVSDFVAHAGFMQNKNALNFLYLSSGKSYTLCQLQAWSSEYKARKDCITVTEVDDVDPNDDTCGLCGDGGDLICCDNCPSTYHYTCLAVQVPEGNWYCPHCTCKICGNVILKEASSLAVLECSQCESKYHDSCAREKLTCNWETKPGTWFCGAGCENVYISLRSRVGDLNRIDDRFSWRILRCNQGEQKIRSAEKIAVMAECNSKLATALILMEECFLPMVDPRTGINMVPHVVYNWGSNFSRLNYRGFCTVVLESNDALISVATLRVHGVRVAEIPLIATCGLHRRQGMCRRLMDVIEKMLTSFKVEMLVLCAIPSLIDTWMSGFGFKPIGDDDKRRLCDIKLMSFPGTTLLYKYLYKPPAEEQGENQDLDTKEYKFHDLDGNVESLATGLPYVEYDGNFVPGNSLVASQILDKGDDGLDMEVGDKMSHEIDILPEDFLSCHTNRIKSDQLEVGEISKDLCDNACGTKSMPLLTTRDLHEDVLNEPFAIEPSLHDCSDISKLKASDSTQGTIVSTEEKIDCYLPSNRDTPDIDVARCDKNQLGIDFDTGVMSNGVLHSCEDYNGSK